MRRLLLVFMQLFLVIFLFKLSICAKNKELPKIGIDPNYKKPSTISYQFTSTNRRYDFMKQVRDSFKKKVVTVTNPINWPGEQGRGVKIPQNLKATAKKRFKENQFNIVASDLIALNRAVPDQRPRALVLLAYFIFKYFFDIELSIDNKRVMKIKVERQNYSSVNIFLLIIFFSYKI
jgi:hypothetical protein